jgi:hypothetical protein
MLDEYHEDSKKGKIYKEVRIPSEEKIKLVWGHYHGGVIVTLCMFVILYLIVVTGEK